MKNYDRAQRAHKGDFPLSPVRRLDQTQTGGGVRRALFERVAAQRIVRVAQPRTFASGRGNREAAANRGRLFFGYFLLAKQKKVTCCRATPGGFRWVSLEPVLSLPKGSTHPAHAVANVLWFDLRIAK